MLRHRCQAFHLFELQAFFLHELKTLNYDGLWENKKALDENERFDWIKSIPGYRLVNMGWLPDINLFNSMI